MPPLRFFLRGRLECRLRISENHTGIDTFDLVTQRSVSHHYIRRGDGAWYVPHNYRYVWPSELDLMAQLAGLEFEAPDAQDKEPYPYI